MTSSTLGMSSPRDATSVAISIFFYPLLNLPMLIYLRF